MGFHFRLIPQKVNHKYLQKFHKTPFWYHFWSILPKIGPMGDFYKIELRQFLALTKPYIYSKQQKK